MKSKWGETYSKLNLSPRTGGVVPCMPLLLCAATATRMKREAIKATFKFFKLHSTWGKDF